MKPGGRFGPPRWWSSDLTRRPTLAAIHAAYAATVPSRQTVVGGRAARLAFETATSRYGKPLLSVIAEWTRTIVLGHAFAELDEPNTLTALQVQPGRSKTAVYEPLGTAHCLAALVNDHIGPLYTTLYDMAYLVTRKRPGQRVSVVDETYAAISYLQGRLLEENVTTGEALLSMTPHDLREIVSPWQEDLRQAVIELALLSQDAAAGILDAPDPDDGSPDDGDPADLLMAHGADQVPFHQDPILDRMYRDRRRQLLEERLREDWIDPLVKKGTEPAITAYGRALELIHDAVRHAPGLVDIDREVVEERLAQGLHRICHGFVGRVSERTLRRDIRHGLSKELFVYFERHPEPAEEFIEGARARSSLLRHPENVVEIIFAEQLLEQVGNYLEQPVGTETHSMVMGLDADGRLLIKLLAVNVMLGGMARPEVDRLAEYLNPPDKQQISLVTTMLAIAREQNIDIRRVSPGLGQRQAAQQLVACFRLISFHILNTNLTLETAAGRDLASRSDTDILPALQEWDPRNHPGTPHRGAPQHQPGETANESVNP